MSRIVESRKRSRSYDIEQVHDVWTPMKDPEETLDYIHPFSPTLPSEPTSRDREWVSGVMEDLPPFTPMVESSEPFLMALTEPPVKVQKARGTKTGKLRKSPLPPPITPADSFLTPSPTNFDYPFPPLSPPNSTFPPTIATTTTTTQSSFPPPPPLPTSSFPPPPPTPEQPNFDSIFGHLFFPSSSKRPISHLFKCPSHDLFQEGSIELASAMAIGLNVQGLPCSCGKTYTALPSDTCSSKPKPLGDSKKIHKERILTLKCVPNDQTETKTIGQSSQQQQSQTIQFPYISWSRLTCRKRKGYSYSRTAKILCCVGNEFFVPLKNSLGLVGVRITTRKSDCIYEDKSNDNYPVMLILSLTGSHRLVLTKELMQVGSYSISICFSSSTAEPPCPLPAVFLGSNPFYEGPIEFDLMPSSPTSSSPSSTSSLSTHLPSSPTTPKDIVLPSIVQPLFYGFFSAQSNGTKKIFLTPSTTSRITELPATRPHSIMFAVPPSSGGRWCPEIEGISRPLSLMTQDLEITIPNAPERWYSVAQFLESTTLPVDIFVRYDTGAPRLPLIRQKEGIVTFEFRMEDLKSKTAPTVATPDDAIMGQLAFLVEKHLQFIEKTGGSPSTFGPGGSMPPGRTYALEKDAPIPTETAAGSDDQKALVPSSKQEDLHLALVMMRQCAKSPVVQSCLVSRSVKALFHLDGTSLNGMDKHGYTMLHYAVFSGHEELILFLLKNGASTSAVDRHGRSVLSFAEYIVAGPEICELLRRSFVSDEEAEPHSPNSPLPVEETAAGGQTIIHIQTLSPPRPTDAVLPPPETTTPGGVTPGAVTPGATYDTATPPNKKGKHPIAALWTRFLQWWTNLPLAGKLLVLLSVFFLIGVAIFVVWLRAQAVSTVSDSKFQLDRVEFGDRGVDGKLPLIVQGSLSNPNILTAYVAPSALDIFLKFGDRFYQIGIADIPPLQAVPNKYNPYAIHGNLTFNPLDQGLHHALFSVKQFEIKLMGTASVRFDLGPLSPTFYQIPLDWTTYVAGLNASRHVEFLKNFTLISLPGSDESQFDADVIWNNPSPFHFTHPGQFTVALSYAGESIMSSAQASLVDWKSSIVTGKNHFKLMGKVSKGTESETMRKVLQQLLSKAVDVDWSILKVDRPVFQQLRGLPFVATFPDTFQGYFDDNTTFELKYLSHAGPDYRLRSQLTLGPKTHSPYTLNEITSCELKLALEENKQKKHTGHFSLDEGIDVDKASAVILKLNSPSSSELKSLVAKILLTSSETKHRVLSEGTITATFTTPVGSVSSLFAFSNIQVLSGLDLAHSIQILSLNISKPSNEPRKGIVLKMSLTIENPSDTDFIFDFTSFNLTYQDQILSRVFVPKDTSFLLHRDTTLLSLEGWIDSESNPVTSETVASLITDYLNKASPTNLVLNPITNEYDPLQSSTLALTYNENSAPNIPNDNSGASIPNDEAINAVVGNNIWITLHQMFLTYEISPRESGDLIKLCFELELEMKNLFNNFVIQSTTMNLSIFILKNNEKLELGRMEGNVVIRSNGPTGSSSSSFPALFSGSMMDRGDRALVSLIQSSLDTPGSVQLVVEGKMSTSLSTDLGLVAVEDLPLEPQIVHLEVPPLPSSSVQVHLCVKDIDHSQDIPGQQIPVSMELLGASPVGFEFQLNEQEHFDFVIYYKEMVVGYLSLRESLLIRTNYTTQRSAYLTLTSQDQKITGEFLSQYLSGEDMSVFLQYRNSPSNAELPSLTSIRKGLEGLIWTGKLHAGIGNCPTFPNSTTLSSTDDCGCACQSSSTNISPPPIHDDNNTDNENNHENARRVPDDSGDAAGMHSFSGAHVLFMPLPVVNNELLEEESSLVSADVRVDDLRTQVVGGSCPPQKLALRGVMNIEMLLPTDNICIYGFSLNSVVSTLNESSESLFLGKISLSHFIDSPLPSCHPSNSLFRLNLTFGAHEEPDEMTAINIDNIVAFLANDNNESESYKNAKAYQQNCAVRGTGTSHDDPEKQQDGINEKQQQPSLKSVVQLKGHITLQVALSNDSESAFYIQEIPFQQLVTVSFK